VKAEWKKSGATIAVTLGDDSSKAVINLEQMASGSSEQVTPLFRAANPLRLPRGNATGTVAFTVDKSHATAADAATNFKAEMARLNEQGTLVLTIGATTMTFANATLTEVTAARTDGCRWAIRYSFGTTTLT
jgi:hypothetical protein